MALRQAIILSIAVSLFSQQCVSAEQNSALRERLIGGTFKNLAKTFVMVNDIEKIKGKNIAKIRKMDDEKFNKRRDEIYTILKDLPPSFKENYKISQDMTREQIIENINSLNKQKMNKIIDEIPDSFIASLFDQHMQQTKQNIMQGNIAEQIKDTWGRIVKKAQGN
jgi:Mg/Co/Ni transporter MgtE